MTTAAATALVIESDPDDHLCRMGDWLTEAGLELDVVRPHTGDPLPPSLENHQALIVLGGPQDAFGEPSASGAPWFPQTESLLRKAVRYHVATLGICLGGQLLALAHGGAVQRSANGPEYGAKLVAKRDIAVQDPLFGPVPFAPDVIQCHRDEITELPAAAVLLAASPAYPHQAFRIGDRAWGVQFHPEVDLDMFATWMRRKSGVDAAALIAGVAAALDDVREVWQPFAARFADLACGRLDPAPRTQLPLA